MMKFFTTITNKNFIGSTILLFFGLITTIGALTNPNRNDVIVYAFPGICLTVGALVYQSAKKRRMGLVKGTWWRKWLEFLAMITMVVVFFKTQEILQLLQDGDITSIVILAGTIIAYLIARASWQKRIESPGTPTLRTKLISSSHENFFENLRRRENSTKKAV